MCSEVHINKYLATTTLPTVAVAVMREEDAEASVARSICLENTHNVRLQLVCLHYGQVKELALQYIHLFFSSSHSRCLFVATFALSVGLYVFLEEFSTGQRSVFFKTT